MSTDDTQNGSIRITNREVYDVTVQHGKLLDTISTQLGNIGAQLAKFEVVQTRQDATLNEVDDRLKKSEGRYLDTDRQRAFEDLINVHLARKLDGSSLNRGTRWTIYVMAAGAIGTPIIGPIVGPVIKHVFGG